MKSYASLLLGILALPISAFAQEKLNVKDVNCEVEFKYDSTEYDQNKMASCLKAVPDHKLDFFYLYTSASMEGSQEYNQKLTDSRAQAVIAQLKKLFPGIRTEVISGGENVKGRIAKVSAILIDERPVKRLETDIQDIKTSISQWRKNRFVARAAIGDYKPSDTTYEVFGGEYARLFDDNSKPYYFELGIGGNYFSDDDVLDLYSVDIFGGAYYRHGYFQAGLRPKAGYLSRTDNKEGTIDIGGDLRLGAEGERFSAFLTGGMYKDFNIYGIEFGVRL